MAFGAVTFDLWQTLIVDTPEGLRKARADRVSGVHAFIAREGHRVDLAAVDAAYDAVGARLETLRADRRDIGSRGQVRMLLDALGIEHSVPSDGSVTDDLEQTYCLPILSAPPVANAGAAELLAALCERGIRLALICDTGRTPGTMLRIPLARLGLSRVILLVTQPDDMPTVDRSISEPGVGATLPRLRPDVTIRRPKPLVSLQPIC